jgi:5-methylcytosine-specific restriction endonuclease McrA
MYKYCTEVLRLSESEAYLRIAAARAAGRHPMLLDMLRDGRLHLSGIERLAPILTETNREEVLARAAGRTRRKIEELVAEIAPKPDVPSTMRKLPERREEKKATPVLQLRPDGVANHPKTLAPARPAVVKPLAPAKYKIQFTASAGLRDKLERLKALMRSTIPDGDLAAIIEEAITEKLERLESKRFGKTKAPRKDLKETNTLPSSRYIPAAVKRAVYERDKGQCTYIDPNGRRCTERHRLEFDHRKPYGRGGDHSVSNLRLLCKAHNGYFAERDYGKEVVERYRIKRNSGSRVSEPTVFYTYGNRATRLSRV